MAGAATRAETPKGAVERLIAEVVQAGGVLRVQRPPYAQGQRRGDTDYQQLVQSAKRSGKVPPGMRLTTRDLAWPGMEIRLEPAILGTEVSYVASRPAIRRRAGLRSEPEQHLGSGAHFGVRAANLQTVGEESERLVTLRRAAT